MKRLYYVTWQDASRNVLAEGLTNDLSLLPNAPESAKASHIVVTDLESGETAIYSRDFASETLH